MFVVGVLAGATASLVGFGIGSLLTPVVAAHTGMAAAIAIVALPHALATGLRCWRLRRAIDRGVLVRFGTWSALGGLSGAALYTRLEDLALTGALGGLLVLTAVAHLTGLARRWRPRGAVVAALGLGSGFFGGVAGNQGGLRAAALGAFGLAPAAFVATATATGLIVDAARTPLYVWRLGDQMLAWWPVVAVAGTAVAVGTLAGERMLFGLTVGPFARIVAAAIGLLGLALIGLAW